MLANQHTGYNTLDSYFAEGLGSHLLFQHLKDCHLLCIRRSTEKQLKDTNNQQVNINLQTSKIVFFQINQYTGFRIDP